MGGSSIKLKPYFKFFRDNFESKKKRIFSIWLIVFLTMSLLQSFQLYSFFTSLKSFSYVDMTPIECRLALVRLWAQGFFCSVNLILSFMVFIFSYLKRGSQLLTFMTFYWAFILYLLLSIYSQEGFSFFAIISWAVHLLFILFSIKILKYNRIYLALRDYKKQCEHVLNAIKNTDSKQHMKALFLKLLHTWPCAKYPLKEAYYAAIEKFKNDSKN
jgi:hypothetical protein